MSAIVSTTLLEAVEKFSIAQPERVAFSWLDDHGDVVSSLTYGDVAEQSSRLAAHLVRDRGIGAGERVLLVYPPSLQFVVVFLGCLKAGIIAVPTFPPDPNRLNKDVAMFSVIAASCGAKIALTSSSYNQATKLATIKSGVLLEKGAAWPQLDWIVTDSVLVDSKLAYSEASALQRPPNDVAFLQYTSGSTSEPKGVVITQKVLAHNLKLIITGLKADQSTVVVSWLPQYHDMGLIGSYLGALYCGGCGFYLSPVSFIRNPVLWIMAMSKYRATHIQAPNFAYALCARKFLAHVARTKTPLSPIDLSSVKHMINAAEPVEASSIDMFYGVFCKYGLANNVIFPTYGLAEHCVYCCSNGEQRLVLDKIALERDRRVRIIAPGQDTDVGSTIVSLGCGKPSESDSVDLRIVDTEGLFPVPEGIVGEIWIKSLSTAAGYWGLADKTKEDFDAALSEDLGEGSIYGGGEAGFLRTGDLGFMHNGELFICGRLKDLIIIRGRNHYPQDIERTAESIKPVVDGYEEVSLRGGCSAAFSVPVSGQEMLHYAVEVSCSKVSQTIASGLIDHIRGEINRVHGVVPAVILLLEPRSIPKTTSGKIARQWARRAYLDGTMKILDSWSSSDAMGNEGMEASAAPSQGLMGAVEHDDDAIDPTGQPVDFVLDMLKKAVAVCTEQSNAELIATDVPLMNLGMDSLRGVQLQSILERKFTVPLPEELMFEHDATLRTIGNALIAGGVVRPRPFMINMWDVVSAVRKLAEKTPKGRPPPPGPLPQQWFKERMRRSDVDNHTFPDGCATPKASLETRDEKRFLFLSAILLSGPLLLLATSILLLVLLPTQASFASISILTSLFLFPIDLKTWPARFRRSALLESATRFFSFRVIVERVVDPKVPVIFAVGPGTSLPVGSLLLCLAGEFFLGFNIQLLLRRAIISFPLAGALFRLMGCVEDSPQALRNALKAKRSVCIGFSSVNGTKEDSILLPRNKDFVYAALEQGAQIIPCYCFGSSQATAAKPFPGTLAQFPARVPLLFVIGRPVVCPQVDEPSPELVNEFHESFLREERRIFEAYKNTFAPTELRLTLKR